MINKITAANRKTNFCGTTIIKQEGGSFLTKEIMDVSSSSRPGLINTRLDGYSMVIVADAFKKEERKFLKHLDGLNIPYVNSTKHLNYKLYDLPELKEMAKILAKTGLI